MSKAVKTEGPVAETGNKRTPRNVESILKGALKLKLPERIELKKQLEASIAAEVKSLQDLIQVATS